MAIIEQHTITETVKVQLVSNSKVWQLRFKDQKSNKWLTRSTKKTNLIEAIAAAKEVTESTTPTFKQVALEWISAQPKGARMNREYTNSLYTYAFPTLATIRIDKITQKVITKLQSHRQELFESKYKKLPAKSTILNWNASINAVFDYAIINEYAHHTALPTLTAQKQGINNKRRFHFADKQLATLLNSDFYWQKTKNQKTEQIRKILFYYIQFLLGSGVRHGTETATLTADSFSTITVDQQQYKAVTIKKGKVSLYTGDRLAILQPSAADGAKGLIALGKPNEPILQNFSTDRFTITFKQLLEFENMYQEGYSLYSLRHTYITRRLLAGVNASVIAKTCGTSIEMIERNYSHVTAQLAAKHLIPDASIYQSPITTAPLSRKSRERAIQVARMS